jgi:hypothetical protein
MPALGMAFFMHVIEISGSQGMFFRAEATLVKR